VSEAILAAAAGLARVSIPADTTVIVEGQQSGQLFVLETGVVAVTRASVPVATIDTPGSIFGELAVLLNSPATATVHTIGACKFRVSQDPEAFLRARPEVALEVATLLARRLDALTRYLVDVREQYADHDDHLGVVDVVLETLSHHQGEPPNPGSDREHEAPY
jgi:CRP/FNR family cyclic AMP-dependent transcriptional regulator